MDMTKEEYEAEDIHLLSGRLVKFDDGRGPTAKQLKDDFKWWWCALAAEPSLTPDDVVSRLEKEA